MTKPLDECLVHLTLSTWDGRRFGPAICCSRAQALEKEDKTGLTLHPYLISSFSQDEGVRDPRQPLSWRLNEDEPAYTFILKCPSLADFCGMVQSRKTAFESRSSYGLNLNPIEAQIETQTYLIKTLFPLFERIYLAEKQYEEWCDANSDTAATPGLPKVTSVTDKIFVQPTNDEDDMTGIWLDMPHVVSEMPAKPTEVPVEPSVSGSE